MNSFFSALSGILFIAAFVPYIGAILRGRTLPSGTEGKAEPSKASWLIWAALDIIALINMYRTHSVNYQIVAAVFGASTVAILSMRYGKPGWEKVDYTCFVGALIAVVLMYVNSELSLLFSLVGLFIGGIPSFKRALKKPEQEDKLSWFLFWISCVFALLSIPTWTFAFAAQPVTFFIIETIMVILIFRPCDKDVEEEEPWLDEE